MPFKVPFNIVSTDRQATPDKEEPICDENAPLLDPDSANQKASIDLTDQDDETLPCGSDCLTKSLICDCVGSKCSLSSSFAFESPGQRNRSRCVILSEDSGAYLPYRVMVELKLYFSPRLRTET